ncbi:MAG: ABC transporter permease, partial [Candidatus Thermoplasmatota archaeon]|nr:ABC transporter permease [Candidatus Thermoplasmatota archaeon]
MTMSETVKVHRHIPSDAAQVPIVWRYELLKYLRSKRLIASIAIAALVVCLIYAIPILTGDGYGNTTAEQFSVTFVQFASILVVICATFFGADSIVGEFQSRTGYLVFPTPMKREILFLGKFMASMTSGIVVMTLFYLGVGGLSFATVGGVDADFLASYGFALEYLLAAMAIAYFISSIMKGSTGATVLTFFLFIMILPIIDMTSMVSGVKVQGSLTFAGGAVVDILMDPYPVDTTQEYVPGRSFYNFYPDPAMAALVMIIYAVIAL